MIGAMSSLARDAVCCLPAPGAGNHRHSSSTHVIGERNTSKTAFSTQRGDNAPEVHFHHHVGFAGAPVNEHLVRPSPSRNSRGGSPNGARPLAATQQRQWHRLLHGWTRRPAGIAHEVREFSP
jgi:hypothetical protein